MIIKVVVAESTDPELHVAKFVPLLKSCLKNLIRAQPHVKVLHIDTKDRDHATIEGGTPGVRGHA